VTIFDEVRAHRKSWPAGCGVKECDVCSPHCTCDRWTTGVGSLKPEPPCPVHSEGRKYDKDKLRYDLIPFKALDAVVGVLSYGAKKYAPENWRKVDGWRWRYFGAALRHMVAWFGGERVDPESGHKHLAHAACCLMFALELDAP
jgi:hypothetical protein